MEGSQRKEGAIRCQEEKEEKVNPDRRTGEEREAKKVSRRGRENGPGWKDERGGGGGKGGQKAILNTHLPASHRLPSYQLTCGGEQKDKWTHLAGRTCDCHGSLTKSAVMEYTVVVKGEGKDDN